MAAHLGWVSTGARRGPPRRLAAPPVPAARSSRVPSSSEHRLAGRIPRPACDRRPMALTDGREPRPGGWALRGGATPGATCEERRSSTARPSPTPPIGATVRPSRRRARPTSAGHSASRSRSPNLRSHAAARPRLPPAPRHGQIAGGTGHAHSARGETRPGPLARSQGIAERTRAPHARGGPRPGRGGQRRAARGAGERGRHPRRARRGRGEPLAASGSLERLGAQLRGSERGAHALAGGRLLPGGGGARVRHGHLLARPPAQPDPLRLAALPGRRPGERAGARGRGGGPGGGARRRVHRDAALLRAGEAGAQPEGARAGGAPVERARGARRRALRRRASAQERHVRRAREPGD
jgi:translation initiation factor IF-2